MAIETIFVSESNPGTKLNAYRNEKGHLYVSISDNIDDRYVTLTKSDAKLLLRKISAAIKQM